MNGLRRAVWLGVALLAAACLWAGFAGAAPERALPALAPAPKDALTRALVDGRLTEAQYALERARSLFQLAKVRARFGDVARPGGRQATVVLRDLAVRVRQLSGGERAAAEALLARPDDGDVPVGNGWTAPEAPASPECIADLCIHWVASGPDAPPPADADTDGVPNWVELTRATWAYVWAEEIGPGGIGYREPLPDGSSANDGGDNRLDVYLDNLGSDSVFGYCTSDDPHILDTSVFAVSAYCVVDDDYLDYGSSQTPAEFLQVTSAHEFNHASQFAYDWLEDWWLLEGTATNIEETIYPDVDDNLVFLDFYSPLTRPAVPLDRGGLGDSEYGSWIFWRFLEEKLFDNDPTVARRVWERADAASPAAPDDYSLRAVRNALAANGIAFREAFAQFGTANRLLDYEDGSLYPSTPTHGVFRISPSAPGTGWRSALINHLATRFYSFTPGRRVAGDDRIRLRVNLPLYGSEATLIIFFKSGARQVRRLGLNAARDGSFLAPFGRGVVTRVDLVLSNGSSRTTCWRDNKPPFYSCLGIPRDDRRAYLFKATLVP